MSINSLSHSLSPCLSASRSPSLRASQPHPPIPNLPLAPGLPQFQTYIPQETILRSKHTGRGRERKTASREKKEGRKGTKEEGNDKGKEGWVSDGETISLSVSVYVSVNVKKENETNR